MKEPKPSDWDWVTARKECSMPLFFERLKTLAQRDVKTRHAMRQELIDLGPVNFDAQIAGTFTVLRNFAPGHHASVRFRLEGDRLFVEGAGVQVNFDGSLTLTDDGDCRLRVGEKELDPWQVLRRALEPLFFGL